MAHGSVVASSTPHLNVFLRFVIGLAAELAGRMPGAVESAIATVHPVLSPSTRVLADRLGQFVLSTTNKLAARIAG